MYIKFLYQHSKLTQTFKFRTIDQKIDFFYLVGVIYLISSICMMFFKNDKNSMVQFSLKKSRIQPTTNTFLPEQDNHDSTSTGLLESTKNAYKSILRLFLLPQMRLLILVLFTIKVFLFFILLTSQMILFFNFKRSD